MAHKFVKVNLRDHVTTKIFWRATYATDSDLGIELLPDFNHLKKLYLDGKLTKLGSLEVSVPISYYNKHTETLEDDFIEYDYIKDSKHIWEIIEA
ncbi:hypothetical protein EDC19_1769 [Natranaerovirga hydrolytica]|uniref:Uncharacterized protein n=1 Tax=Natranaerovirga hydrolytica TaxID=680378 RepID=A0A4R1MKP7_9FIRM|nr:hypothetical protein [Natranaerovirga hydrolytica]TCK92620.1 hypothetical protein EDC19_1769 [Natranaerovirga hydrolytica]